MRLRTLSTLVSVALIGATASCEALYGSFGVDNLDNCARNGELCAATDVCNAVTKLCEPAIGLHAVTPRLGTNRGGYTVVLGGHLLSPDLTVLFDGVPAMVATAPTDNAEQLTVVVPPNPGKKGPIAIELLHPLGQRQQREGLFSYYSPIEFQPTQTPGPRDPRGLLVADWNGDGKNDLLVCENGRQELQLFPGNGDGTLGSAQVTALGLSPTACAMADLAGDGKLDVVAIDRFGASIQVILGDGSGGFQAQPAAATTRQYSDLTVGDLNGDGKADVIVGDPPGAAVLLSDGAGGFSSTTRYAVHVNTLAGVFVATGDMNGDGKLDIITANAQDAYYGALYGDGQGGFPGTPTLLALPKAPKRAVLADVNRDGRLDIVGAGAGEMQIYVSLSKPDGSYDPPLFYKVASSINQLAVADLNGDNLPDAAWFSVVTKNNVGTYLGLGDGNLIDEQSYTEGIAPQAGTLGDLNGDGKLDLIIGEAAITAPPATGKLRILLNKSE